MFIFDPDADNWRRKVVCARSLCGRWIRLLFDTIILMTFGLLFLWIAAKVTNVYTG
jgi:hypothetical protein